MEQQIDTAAPILAELLANQDQFAVTISEHVLVDFWPKANRIPLTQSQRRKHERAGRLLDALRDIANSNPESLSDRECVIRDSLIAAFAERADELVELQ